MNTESDWVDYLKGSGNYETYDGICDCYTCRKIRKEFEAWKSKPSKKERDDLKFGDSGDPNIEYT